MLENILDNILAVRTVSNEQNKFLSTLTGGAASNIAVASFEDVPKRTFRKFKKLLMYDGKLRRVKKSNLSW